MFFFLFSSIKSNSETNKFSAYLMYQQRKKIPIVKMVKRERTEKTQNETKSTENKNKATI